MAREHEETGANQPSQASPRKPRRLRVLIVEDEPIIAMELEMLLEELENEVVGIAISAEEAFSYTRKFYPDFITMDINISGDCDGVAVAQEIFEKCGVRSIFISAHADAATRQRAEPCNPIGWIVKPVSHSDLSDLMTRVQRHND